jgi:tetrahydromethanopterin S-methyltransferase subunit E
MSNNQARLGDQIINGITQLIRFALLAVGAYALIRGRWSVAFAATGTLVLSYLPQLLASTVKVRLPLQFQFFITVFLYASIFLGEVGDYYEKFWWWDVVLHAGSAFAFGFVGFLTLYLLYARHKLATSPFLLSWFAFCFGLALGAIWEVFEFTMDQAFGFNMQKSGLQDTMWDLIVDGIGAGIASTIGYIYLRFKVRDPFDFLIQWFVRENPQFRSRRLGRRSR